jgi:hypothetical protein
MNFNSFWSDVIATVVGGMILTFLFFLLREKLFGYKDLDGSWVYDQTTHTSEYNPYKGMKVRFLVLMARDGSRVYGSAEKIYEITSDGTEREYIGKNRIRAELSGHIEKRYFSRDRISIHIVENGERRESSTFHILECKNKNLLEGRFSSTIANQIGVVTWSRRSS